VCQAAHKWVLPTLCHTVTLFDTISLAKFTAFIHWRPLGGTYVRHLWLAPRNMFSVQQSFFKQHPPSTLRFGINPILTAQTQCSEIVRACPNLLSLATLESIFPAATSITSTSIIDLFCLNAWYSMILSPPLKLSLRRFYVCYQYGTLRLSLATLLATLPNLESIEEYMYNLDVEHGISEALSSSSLKRYGLTGTAEVLAPLEAESADPRISFRKLPSRTLEPRGVMYDDWRERVDNPALWRV
jgi:hypothetical protein